MFVGDRAIPLPASRDEWYTTASVARSVIRSPQRGQRLQKKELAKFYHHKMISVAPLIRRLSVFGHPIFALRRFYEAYDAGSS
jgi:hypothetical protein